MSAKGIEGEVFMHKLSIHGDLEAIEKELIVESVRGEKRIEDTTIFTLDQKDQGGYCTDLIFN